MSYKRVVPSEEPTLIYSWDYTLIGNVIIDLNVKASNGGLRVERISVTNDTNGKITSFSNEILKEDPKTNSIQFTVSKSDNLLMITSITYMFDELFYNIGLSISTVEQLPDIVEHFSNYIKLNQASISSSDISDLQTRLAQTFDNYYIDGNTLWFNGYIYNIPVNAFSGHTLLTDFYSETAITINNNAFMNSGLKYLTLPQVVSFGSNVFTGCTGITLSVPAGYAPSPYTSYSATAAATWGPTQTFAHIDYRTDNYLLVKNVDLLHGVHYTKSGIEDYLGITISNYFKDTGATNDTLGPYDEKYSFSDKNYHVSGIGFRDHYSHELQLQCKSIGDNFCDLYGIDPYTVAGDDIINIKNFNFPLLETMGDWNFVSFFDNGYFRDPDDGSPLTYLEFFVYLERINTPKLKTIGENNFLSLPYLIEVSAPNLILSPLVLGATLGGIPDMSYMEKYNFISDSLSRGGVDEYPLIPNITGSQSTFTFSCNSITRDTPNIQYLAAQRDINFVIKQIN